MRSIGCAALTLALLFICESHAQPRDLPSETFGFEAGKYSVGFQLFDERDPSRAVTGGSSSKPQPRPVRVYVWYPAERAARPMTLARYAALADEDVWPEDVAGALRDKLKFARGPLARALDPAAFEAFLKQPVRATENAKPLRGPFPLVIVGQGLYYESPIALAALSEYLAGAGVVVATAPLVGTNSPFVKLDPQDLETQVRDLEFAIARARQLSFVSPDALGVLGFDMGGMAGVVLTMRNRDVDAFMSMDSGILVEHPSGLPRSSPDYDVAALRVPWFHAEHFEPGQSTQSGAELLFDTATHAERHLLVMRAMQHADFTSYGLVEGRPAAPGYWPPGTQAGGDGMRAIARYAQNFFAAYLTRSSESQAFLSAPPDDPALAARVTLEHRAATRAPMSYDEFVHAAVDGRVDEAVSNLRSAAASGGDNVLLKEFYLDRLAVSLVFTWGLTQEALRVIELNAELHPDSNRAQINLAEAYAAVGNYAAATEVYSRYVEQHPDDARAKSRLEQFRNR